MESEKHIQDKQCVIMRMYIVVFGERETNIAVFTTLDKAIEFCNKIGLCHSKIHGAPVDDGYISVNDREIKYITIAS